MTKSLLALIALTSSAFAGNITIEWQYPVPANFTVYRLLSPGLGIVAKTTETRTTVNLPQDAVLVVTATIDGVESEPSNELSIVVPTSPTNLRIIIEGSANVSGPWETLVETTKAVDQWKAFYRARIEKLP